MVARSEHLTLVRIAQRSSEWHAYRERRITGSTAAGILGVATRKRDRPTALSEWARLTGKVKPPKLEGPWLDWGIESEPMNRALYQRKTGRRVDPINAIAQHPSLDWLCYSPDGLVIACEAISPLVLPALWEAKAPAPWNDDFDDALPLEYQVQTQIGMECMGLDWTSFSALIWPGVRVFDVPRDQRFIDACMTKLANFMEHNVKRDVPPEACGSDRDASVLAEIAQPLRGWDWSEAVAIKYAEVERLQRSLKDGEYELEALKNRLVQLTGQSGWKQAKAEIIAARRAVTA